MKKKKPPLKTYTVNVDMMWSEDYLIKARTAGEAKKKAWARFKRFPPRKNFQLDADRD